MYRATVTLMVGNAIQNLNPSNNEFTLTQQLADTYVDMVKRRPVQEGTRTVLGLDWLPEHYAYRIAGTQLFAITVTDADPARAQIVANEMANQLILQSPAGNNQDYLQRQEFIKQQLDEIQTGIVETQNQIRTKQSELAQLFQARQIADTQAQISALQSNLSTLQQTYANLFTGTQRGAINTISVVEPAVEPRWPTNTDGMRIILLAAAMGFVLSIGASYVLEYIDDTVRTKQDVAKLTGTHPIGTIPAQKRTYETKLAWNEKSFPAVREAYRRLRANLEASSHAHRLFSLMVAGPTEAEDSATVAANLGVALTQTGKRVILVDADLQTPKLHTLFDIDNEIGLAGLLNGWHSGRQGLQSTWVPGLSILSTGPRFAEEGELTSQQIHRLLAELSNEADAVIINVPPINAVADAMILAGQVDGLLLVVDLGRTRRTALTQAVEYLHEVNANILGTVLNRLAVTQKPHSYRSGPRLHKKVEQTTLEISEPPKSVPDLKKPPLQRNMQAKHKIPDRTDRSPVHN
jgi:non-specific protein-tyrosine kinase